MPLHAEEEAARRILERLHDPVVARRRHEQSGRDEGDRLMVHRVRQQRARACRFASRFEIGRPSGLAAQRRPAARAAAQHALKQRAGRDVDALVRHVVGRPLPMIDRGDPAGARILVKRASQRHVHHLHAPTDAQHGQVAFVRRAGELQLERVASGGHLDGFGEARRVAVAPRIHVAAARKHERVHPLDHLARRGLVRLVAVAGRWQQHRCAPGRGHAAHVLHRDALHGYALVLLLFHRVRGGDPDDHALASDSRSPSMLSGCSIRKTFRFRIGAQGIHRSGFGGPGWVGARMRRVARGREPGAGMRILMHRRWALTFPRKDWHGSC